MPIYLDNNATTRIDPRVLDEMLPFLREDYGNAASTHRHGKAARAAVERARAEVGALIGAHDDEVAFTSGATESINTAIKGLARGTEAARRHLVTSKIEHKATLDSVKALERAGWEVTLLTPDREGRFTPEQVAKSLRSDTALVSLMLANNEIGSLNPIAEVGALLAPLEIPLHCDAAQGLTTEVVRFEQDGLGACSMSAHKIYGPKGIGALVVRRGLQRSLEPLMHGGGHERGMRSGTLNVAGIVGFGAAARIAQLERDDERRRVTELRDGFLQRLSAALPRIHLNGAKEARQAGNLSIAFDGVEAKKLIAALDEHVSVSAGSACTAASLDVSHVLRTIGIGHDRAMSSVRFGIGRFTTAAEIELVLELVVAHVRALRAGSPVWQAETSLADAAAPRA